MAAAAPVAQGHKHRAGCAAPWHGQGKGGTGHGAAAQWGSRGTGKISADPGLCTIFGILRLIITRKKIIGDKDGTKFWSSEEMMGIRQNSWDHLLN